MKNIIGNWKSKDQLSRVDTTREKIGKWEVLHEDSVPITSHGDRDVENT